MKTIIFGVLAVILVPVTASAKPVDGIGFRVGGYGFREAATADTMGEEGPTGWDACRMNGLGVFVAHDLSRTFYLEGGVNTYFTDSFPSGEATGTYDTPIDRVSGLFTVAAGARFFPNARVSPYVQLGAGAEVTRVRLPALGMEDTALLPVAFFGVGASVRLGRHLRLGATLRVNAMGYYDDAQFQTELAPKTELATQGQFFAVYDL